MSGLEALRQDVPLALRHLRKSPAFTAAAVFTLALGIGVNVAVFGVVNGFILRPLPVRDGDRLAVVATRRAPDTSLRAASHPDLADYRAASGGVFEDIAGYSAGFVGLAPEGARPQRVLATWVTGSYFPLLDLRAAAGRLIGAEEGQPGRVDAVAVLGHSTWRRRFGGDPSAVGRVVKVDGRPVTIVGVAPPGFAGTFAFSDSELYLPVNRGGGDGLDRRDVRWLHTLARLRPGVTLADAQATLDAVAARLEHEHPETNAGVRVAVVAERLARPEEDNARTNGLGAAILMAMVGLVLVVAAVNVTFLLLARWIDRRREIAIRVAIGAGRARIVRLVATESLIVASFGGIAGAVLGAWTARLMAGIRLPGDLPVRFDFALDVRGVAFVALATVFAAALAGTIPALRASRVDVGVLLRGGEIVSRTRGRRDVRGVLIASQIAVCVLLLSGAGLFLRSLARSERMDPGFEPRGVLNVSMDVGQLGYTEAQGRAFFEDVERRVRATAGVQDASFAFTVPMGYVSTGHVVEGEGAAPGGRPFAGKNAVGAGYFSTMGIPIVRGRRFDERDHGPARPIAVVNERLAAELWPGLDAVGRRLREAGSTGRWLEVVGVTRTGKYRLLFEDPQPHYYVPLAQHETALRVLHVRTSMAPDALAPAIERVIREREPQIVLFDVQGMDRALGGGYGLFLVRVAAVFAGIFGVLALALAVVGLFGVASYAASQRTREIGVRIALGASPRAVVRLLVRDGLSVVGVGLLAGLSLALLVSGVLRGFLFGLSARDPLTFAGVVPLLGLAALTAYAVPAVRAARVDPAVTLRRE